MIESIGLIFLMHTNNVVILRRLIKGPAELVFGSHRTQKREFAVQDVTCVERNRRENSKATFENGL